MKLTGSGVKTTVPPLAAAIDFLTTLSTVVAPGMSKQALCLSVSLVLVTNSVSLIQKGHTAVTVLPNSCSSTPQATSIALFFQLLSASNHKPYLRYNLFIKISFKACPQITGSPGDNDDLLHTGSFLCGSSQPCCCIKNTKIKQDRPYPCRF